MTYTPAVWQLAQDVIDTRDHLAGAERQAEVQVAAATDRSAARQEYVAREAEYRLKGFRSAANSAIAALTAVVGGEEVAGVLAEREAYLRGATED